MRMPQRRGQGDADATGRDPAAHAQQRRPTLMPPAARREAWSQKTDGHGGDQAQEKGRRDRAHELLQDQAHSPGSQQGLKGASIEPADHRALQQQARQTAHQEGDGNGDQDVNGEQTGEGTGLEQVLHHEGGVSPEHHQLTMGHVDDAHQAEDNGQAEGGQHQHRADGQPIEERVE
jgi:hypothetical protein